MRLSRAVIWPPARERPSVPVAIAIVSVVTLGVVIVEQRTTRWRCTSKADIARATAKEFVYAAYPQWAATHPDQRCPRSIDDLREFTTDLDLDLTDPWGGRWRLHC